MINPVSPQFIIETLIHALRRYTMIKQIHMEVKVGLTLKLFSAASFRTFVELVLIDIGFALLF